MCILLVFSSTIKNLRLVLFSCVPHRSTVPISAVTIMGKELIIEKDRKSNGQILFNITRLPALSEQQPESLSETVPGYYQNPRTSSRYKRPIIKSATTITTIPGLTPTSCGIVSAGKIPRLRIDRLRRG